MTVDIKPLQINEDFKEIVDKFVGKDLEVSIRDGANSLALIMASCSDELLHGDEDENEIPEWQVMFYLTSIIGLCGMAITSGGYDFQKCWDAFRNANWENDEPDSYREAFEAAKVDTPDGDVE